MAVDVCYDGDAALVALVGNVRELAVRPHDAAVGHLRTPIEAEVWARLDAVVQEGR